MAVLRVRRGKVSKRPRDGGTAQHPSQHCHSVEGWNGKLGVLVDVIWSQVTNRDIASIAQCGIGHRQFVFGGLFSRLRLFVPLGRRSVVLGAQSLFFCPSKNIQHFTSAVALGWSTGPSRLKCSALI